MPPVSVMAVHPILFFSTVQVVVCGGVVEKHLGNSILLVEEQQVCSIGGTAMSLGGGNGVFPVGRERGSKRSPESFFFFFSSRSFPAEILQPFLSPPEW